MPRPSAASTVYPTECRTVPAQDLQVGDCPISIAGWRRIEKIRVMPRAKQVVIWTSLGKHKAVGLNTPILMRRYV